MELDKSVEYMLKVRNDLRNQRGVADPVYISENMQRLTHYTSAVEEHLAELEERLEVVEMEKFLGYLKQGDSVNKAEIRAKQEVGDIKGSVARLKRLVSSSWSVIGVCQSRINHLQKEYQQGGRIT